MKPTSAIGVLSGSAALVAMNPPSSSLPLSGTCCLLSVSSRPGMIQISFLPEENSCSCLLLFSEGGFFCLRRFSNFLFRSAAVLSALSRASFSSSSCLLAYLIRGKNGVVASFPGAPKFGAPGNEANGVATYNLLKHSPAFNKCESRQAISVSLNNSTEQRFKKYFHDLVFVYLAPPTVFTKYLPTFQVYIKYVIIAIFLVILLALVS